jgi:tight adherence protein C
MLLLTLLAAALLGTAIALVLRAAALPRLRAAERVDAIRDYGFAAPASSAPGTSTSTPRAGLFAALAGWLGERVAPRLGMIREQGLRRELLAAGMYRMAPRSFLGYRVLATIALPVLGWLMGISLDPPLRLGLVAYCAVMGWVLPLTLVRRRARMRLNEIDRGLPELIDLLVVTVEAGLGFGASLQVAAGRLHGPLAAEIRLTLQEQQMGSTQRDSLERLLARADTASVRSFVRSIVQGETLGVPIGTIMRNLAAEMRKRRRASAEEQAQKAPTKILFPLVFLILPALMVVLLGPPGIEILRTLRAQ